MELRRRENESKIEYLKRLVYGKLKYKTIDYDYQELAPYVFGVELSSCECRKRMYGVLNILEQLDEERFSGIQDKDLLDELTQKTIELKKERQKNQTINAQINKNIRLIAREELACELYSEAMKNLVPLPVRDPFVRVASDQEGILPISDVHFGKQAKIYGLKGEVLNEYNEEVYRRRMDKLMEETIRISRKENLSKLHVLLTGDLIDGMLRMTQIKKLQYGIVESTIRLADHLAIWFDSLSKNIQIPIEIHYCLGNHSQIRPLGSGNGDFKEENMETIITWHLNTKLCNNQNIQINENPTDFIFFNCKGLNIMASHGEERNLESALKDYLLLYGESIDMFIGGHLHTTENKSIGISHKGLSDVEVVRVKSICSIDDYSMKLRKSSSAGTSLLVIEEGKGKTITYDINLQ